MRSPSVLWAIAVLHVAATPLLAQDPGRAPVPGELFAVVPVPDGILSAVPQFSFRLPESPEPRSQALVPLYSWLITLNAMDIRSTYKGLSTGRTREANPLVRPFVNNKAVFVGVKAGLTLTTIWLTEKTRRKHPKRALITMIALDATLAVIVANNYRVAAK
jgi:hypothetical protein